MWCFRAQAQQMLGCGQEAAESFRRAQKLDEELRHAPSRAYLVCLCYYFRLLSDIPQINIWAPSARALSVAEGFTFWVLVADIILAWTSAQQGVDAVAASRKIEASLKIIHDGGTHLVEPEYASMYAETLLLAHRPEEVVRIAEDALAVARIGSQRHFEPELFRLQGEAARAIGDDARAMAFYRQGVECARSMGARLLELRSAMALVRLADGNGERAQLRHILDGFGEGFDQPDYVEAIALVNERRVDGKRKPSSSI